MPQTIGQLKWRHGLAAALLLLLVVALLADRTPTAKIQQRQEQSAAAPTPINPPALPAKPTHERRDAAFWPQTPQPIALRHRTLQPAADFPKQAEYSKSQAIVWIAQFGGPLDIEDRKRLAQRGVETLLPTAANAWHVRTSFNSLQALARDFTPRLLGWARLNAEDHLLPAVHAHRPPVFALLPDGSLRRRVELYPGAAVLDYARHVEELGGACRTFANGWVEVSGPATREFSVRLAGHDAVYAVDFPDPPKAVSNEAAAQASHITAVQGPPNSLTGAGIKIMVRDEGKIFAHPDIASRLLFNADVVDLLPVVHSTHVAGTIGGRCIVDPLALAKGMATDATLVNFDLNGDDVQEPRDAKNLFGAFLSNHAYGFITGWHNGTFTDNQASFGSYGTFARNWDQLVRDEGLVMVKAIGNDRDDSGPFNPHDGTLAPDGMYYDTVDASGTAKNILTVGAAQDFIEAGIPNTAACVLLSSSSGPTDDGRLRPEIIANGDGVSSCNASNTPGQEYTTLSGTSMASAVVTGATALLMEHYQKRFGTTAICTQHYVRALYAQTASDLGRAGPDYLHGFGILDLQSAITLFNVDASGLLQIVNGSISATTPERYFSLYSDGSSPIKTTLCWTDEAGDVLSTSPLINDLDLRLIRVSDQTVFRPFILDREAPELVATTGINTVDTIEQVVLQAPEAGSYLIAVRSSKLATAASFTLTSSLPLTENLAPIARITPEGASGAAPLKVLFNASLSSDPDGAIARYTWTFGDGQSAEGPVVEHMYATGSYTATLTVFDNQGASASASILVGVSNIPPVVVLGVTPDAGLPPLSSLFTAAGSNDPDGQIIDFIWDFGDGTTATGSDVTHTFPAPGLYFVSLTVKDNGGAQVTRSATVFAGQAITANAARFNLNFAKRSKDGFSFTAKALPIAPNMPVAGLQGSVLLGAAEYGFTLDSRGRHKSAPLKVTLTPKSGSIRITLSATVLADALAVTTAGNRTTKNELIRVPFAINLGPGLIFGSKGIPFTYSAKENKSGSGKLIKQ